MNSRLLICTLIGFCILTLTGCKCSDGRCGDPHQPRNWWAIDSVSANFIIPSDDDYDDLINPLLADLNIAQNPNDIHLTISANLELLTSESFTVRFSLFDAANAYSIESPSSSLEVPSTIDPIQSIRVYIFTSNNVNVDSGTELTDQLIVERTSQPQSLGDTLEQWNEICDKQYWGFNSNRGRGLVSVSFLEPEKILPGVYRYYIMATTQDGDLWEAYTEEITFK